MQALILWIHAVAALLLAVLAAVQWRRRLAGVPRVALVAALGLTALWALAVAGIGMGDVVTRITEGLRQLGWLGLMAALALAGERPARARPLAAIYAVVAIVVVVVIGLSIASAIWPGEASGAMIGQARLALRMMVSASALVLVRHLLLSPRGRSSTVRLLALAAATIWVTDLAVYVARWITGDWSSPMAVLRGLALMAIAPQVAMAGVRSATPIQLSRTVAFQSLTAVAVGLYVAATAVAMALIGEMGGEHARVGQTALVFGSAAALLTIATTPWLRAWSKVQIAKHLYSHRYDYRTEWLRFNETLGMPGETSRPLAERVVKAVADLTDSPGGLLLLPEGEGLGAAAGWNWPRTGEIAGGAALVEHLGTTRRIIELDAVRGGRADPADAGCVAAPLIDEEAAWAIVPLIHAGTLAGAIVLARPPIDRALDWEDFDLLGVAGQQVASYLAEDRARAALAESERFDEFNRRFAFILHDLKNLVSQMTLVARNAERHAENPAFRADMVATLRDTAERMSTLLARLSQRGPRSPEALGVVDVAALCAGLATQRRGQHPVEVEVTGEPFAVAEPEAIATLLSHLIQNAIEASGGGAPVRIQAQGDADGVVIDVIDRGGGMSPAFVRDRLFKPFDSGKPGGFGLGAFEARQLAEAMGGSIAVESREGEGSRMRVRLRGAAAPVQRGLDEAA